MSRIPDPPDSLVDQNAAIRWMCELQRVVETALTELRTKKQERGEVQYLRPFTVAQLPPASSHRNTRGAGLVLVTDETGGEVPAWSDGTNWRRVSDRAVVS